MTHPCRRRPCVPITDPPVCVPLPTTTQFEYDVRARKQANAFQERDYLQQCIVESLTEISKSLHVGHERIELCLPAAHRLDHDDARGVADLVRLAVAAYLLRHGYEARFEPDVEEPRRTVYYVRRNPDPSFDAYKILHRLQFHDTNADILRFVGYPTPEDK
jgi:hypothetical protein